MNFRNAFILFFVFIALFSEKVAAQKTTCKTTVVLSLDGFRWDYPSEINTPALNKIASDGVKAASLIPSFPSKTFPNHYTIATGLVPDHHGIVNNAFYDRQTGKSYAIGNKETRFDPIYYGGEPIWITAQHQGLRTASFYWVGSEVAIAGLHPDYWKIYDEETPFINRIDTIIKWLSLPLELRPKLVMAYYHEPDGVGHEYGPGDAHTKVKVHELDSLTGILYNRIRQLPDGDSVNFIVCSDHGMGAISSERNIVLRELIPEYWPVKIEGGNPNFNIYAEGGWIDSVYIKLKNVQGIKVWKPWEVPANLNYGSNPRVGDIIVVADSSWAVSLEHSVKQYSGGTHGYEIGNTDIHAIFYASGPSFKKNYRHPSFQNIHIYPLLAYILGVIPAKCDGDLQYVIDMLNPEL